jgi:hypothetical protein
VELSGTVPTILLSEVDDKFNRLSGSSYLALVCSKLFYFVLSIQYWHLSTWFISKFRFFSLENIRLQISGTESSAFGIPMLELVAQTYVNIFFGRDMCQVPKDKYRNKSSIQVRAVNFENSLAGYQSSGAGSGSVCFWASWIRIRNYPYGSG